MTDSSNKAYAGELVGRGDLTRALIEILQVPEPDRDNDWYKCECLIRSELNDILTRISQDLIIPTYPIHQQEQS